MIRSRLRHLARFGIDIWLYAVRSGRLWMPIAMVLMLISVLLAAAAQAAVPTVVYTLF